MNNRRVMTVKIEKTLQNLPRPFLQSPQINMLMFLSIPTQQLKIEFSIKAQVLNKNKKIKKMK